MKRLLQTGLALLNKPFKKEFFFSAKGTLKAHLLRLTLVSIFIMGGVAAVNLVHTPTAYADPQDSQAECEAAGGTWSVVLSLGVCRFPAPALDWTPTEQATQWAFLNAIELCVRDAKTSSNGWSGANDHINDSDAKSGKWFFDGGGIEVLPKKVAGSYLASNPEDDGNIKCSDLLPQAYSLWQAEYGSYMSLLCSFVPKRDNGSSCEHGSGDFVKISEHYIDFEDSIRDKVWLKNTIEASGAGYYKLYKSAFEVGCSAETNPEASGNFKYTVKEVSNDGTITDVVYEGLEHGHKVKVYTAETLNAQERSCYDIAREINDRSADYAQWIRNHPGVEDAPVASSGDTGGQGAGDTTSCAIEGVGWIVCPVAKFLGWMTDSLFKFLETLLVVEARMFSTNNDSYRAWEAIRNIANVAFVIGFLFIIYSQITGLGLNNYGIKKMLPKIILAAILVNISYWLCAIAVDISNILGTSLQSLLSNAIGGSNSTDNALTGWGEFTAWALGGGVGALAVGGVTLVALGSGGFLAALALLLPILITVLFAFITVILVLAARQAIIVILIVISPLAFVAYLLPNTEQYFEKWRKLFFTMLILFPIIAVIFGGSQLAAAVIRGSTTSATVYLLSLAVQAVPLFITPLVLKFSGGVLNRIGGIINNPNKGPFDRLRKGAEGIRDRQGNRARNDAINSSSSKNPFRRYLRRQARREAIDASQKQGFETGKADYISDLAQRNTSFLANMAAGGGKNATNRALANAINVQLELNVKEVKAAGAVIEHLNLSASQKADLATGRSVTAANGTVLDGSNADALDLRMAAQQSVVKSGDASEINRVVDHMSNLNASDASQAHELNNFAGALESSSSKPAYIQPGDIENMKQNGLGGVSAGTSADMLTQALTDNVYSVAKLAQTGRQEMGIVLNHTVTLPAGDPGRQQIVANAQEVLTDTRLNTSLGKQRSVVESISRL